ncbi:MAG: UPF0175 family protein [Armatimonadetes bacterium]|nr:UPF0175 family protein [Armatimonadota bacterium]MCX7969868.1 UPF0175 family protein [Armatimonadota bacterium]MDW8144542.1 UPF0175 family protein [Armatimonadota bacterium]
MAEVKLDLPPDLLNLLQGMGDVEQAIKECIVLELYQRGEISTGRAAEVLGISYRQFIDLLAKHEIPFFRYSLEELETEMREMEDMR